MTAIFSILAPTTITDSMLISSTVPETEYSAWDIAATYAVGDRCIRNHRVMESQKAGNINKDPSNLEYQVGTAIWWLDIGPSNRWAVFDSEVSTQTTQATSISYVVAPGAFNAIYLGGLDASSVTVSVKDATGGSVVFSGAYRLEGSSPADYYEYFFTPFKPLRNKLIKGIPAYSKPELTITIFGGTAKCGVIAIGFLKELGRTLKGAKAKPKNFGYVDIDKYGKLKAIRGKAATDLSINAIIDHANTRMVQEAIQGALGIPIAVIASDSADYSGLSTFGLLSAEISYDSESTDLLSATVEGLI